MDYQRFASERKQVRKQLLDLATGQKQYVADRDRLIAWGPTDDRVVAGSIVTVKYLSGDLDTFVLTERPFDSEYDVVSYASPMGQVVRRRQVGDRVSLPAGAPLVIHDVRPGFRGTRPGSGTKPVVPNPSATERADDCMPTGTEPDEWLTRQKCSDKAYRDGLYRRRFDPNVRRINEYVDELRAHRAGAFIPYVAPTYGGVNARLLTLYQDPGPKTDPSNRNGSGMLCLENADFSAARAKHFLNKAGIDVSEIISWNAYPWPKPHPQTSATDDEAVVALIGFLRLVPDLSVVVLNGTVAKRIWRLMEQMDLGPAAGMTVYSTFHPSPRAINPAQKPADYIEMVNQDIGKKYIAAGRALRTR